MMESFTNPPDDFIFEQIEHKIPRGVSVRVHETSRECRTTFRLKIYNNWIWFLGRHLCILYSSMAYNRIITFYLSKSIVNPGFTKAFRFTVSDDYVSKVPKPLRDTSADLTEQQETVVKCIASHYYKGTSSYVWGSDIYIDDSLVCSHREMLVNVDKETKRPGPVDALWKAKTIDYLKGIDRPNTGMVVPPFPSAANILHRFTTRVHKNHIDANNHANYQFYLFGSMVCLRNAIEIHDVPGYKNVAYDELIVRDILCVYERECLLGDAITFQLVDGHNNMLYCVGYRDSLRLFYARLLITMLKCT